MTLMELGLHQIEQGLLHFPPDERDDAIRGICSLKLIFKRPASGDAATEEAFAQIEEGMGRLLKSGLLDCFSAASRDEWAEQIAAKAPTFAPDTYQRARKFWR